MAYAEGYYQPLILSLYDLLDRFRNSRDVCNLLKEIAEQRIPIDKGVKELHEINAKLKRMSSSPTAVVSQTYPASQGTVQHLLAELSTTVYLLSGSPELVEILDYASKGGDADKAEEALLMWVRLENDNKDTSAALVPLLDIGRRV